MFDTLKHDRVKWGWLALAIAAVVYAGTKPKIEFLRTDSDINYFIDAGTVVSNDCVILKFQTQIVPLTAPIFVIARELCYTNDEEWVQIAEGRVGDFRNMVIQYTNATNYNFRIYTDWTPGETVHTNGVLNVNWGAARNAEGEPLMFEDKIIAISIKGDNILKDENGNETNAKPTAYTNTVQGLQMLLNELYNANQTTPETESEDIIDEEL